MKRWMKAAPFLAVCLTVCALFAAPVRAEELSAVKEFTLLDNAGASVIEETPSDPAFWEYPTVPAGQTKRTEGVLTIKNNTGLDASVRLEKVELPYDDPDALDYLAALTITIRDGDTVLYSGPYSAVNDGGLNLTAQVPPGQTKSYTVSLRCAFAYKGDPVQVTDRLYWQFKATSTVIENPGKQPPAMSPLVLTLFCVAGGLVLVCAVAGGYAALRKSRH